MRSTLTLGNSRQSISRDEGPSIVIFRYINHSNPKLSKNLARPRRQSSLHSRLFGVEVLEGRQLLATFTVTNLHDSGAGSLRQAIIESNAQPGADTIDFDVAGTIRIGRTSLPAITDTVTIDGYHGPVVRGIAGRDRGLSGFQGTPVRERRRRIDPQVALAGERRQCGCHAQRLGRHGSGQLHRPSLPMERPSPATAETACRSMPRPTAT